MIKSNPIPTRWMTHKLRTIIPKKFSQCCEDSEPHVRITIWGSIKGLIIHRESSFACQRDLIIGLPQDWQKKRL